MLFLLIFFSLTIAFASTCANETIDQQLIEFYLKHPKPIGTLTTSSGAPVSMQETQTINTRLILNNFFLESMTHMVAERIPERVVHAKGAGAFGTFKVTHDLSDICKAKVFSTVGKTTPVAARFSVSFQRGGGTDVSRDLRGFAVKFYTTEGNYDFMGLNSEMFLFKDPINFPASVHAFHKNPATHVTDTNSRWDFLTLRPETLNMQMRLQGDRGIPDGYRHMPGFAIHTFELINHSGNRTFAKFHMLPNLGIKNLTNKEAARIQANDLDYATRDLANAIKQKRFPTWTLSVQTILEQDIDKVGFDIFDVTRFWPVNLFPLRQVGVMELNRNPVNNFAEIEQLAFNPANLVPGIRGVDTVFQARAFTYREAHIHRLGINFNKIPVNCPFRTVASTYNRDGLSPVGTNEGDAPNFFPNSFYGPVPTIDDTLSRLEQHTDPNVNNLDQAGELYSEMSEGEKSRLVANIVNIYSNVTDKRIQNRLVTLFKLVHVDLGKRIENRLKNLPVKKC